MQRGMTKHEAMSGRDRRHSRLEPDILELDMISQLSKRLRASHLPNWAVRIRRVDPVRSSFACQAHNLKVIGSNPIPATKFSKRNQ